jgi:ribosomal-protein-alanine N-acetyltransferase
MTEINIRKADFSDIEQVLKIEQESISSWTFSQFLHELNNEFSNFLVCEYDNSIAGYIIAWKITDEIQLNSIAVKRSLRKQGVGGKLLSALYKDNSGGQFKSVFLEVRSRNSDAISFYINNGFTKTGVRKKYYNDDDAVLMEKKL